MGWRRPGSPLPRTTTGQKGNHRLQRRLASGSPAKVVRFQNQASLRLALTLSASGHLQGSWGWSASIGRVALCRVPLSFPAGLPDWPGLKLWPCFDRGRHSKPCLLLRPSVTLELSYFLLCCRAQRNRESHHAHGPTCDRAVAMCFSA
jgi:hypothetical protein